MSWVCWFSTLPKKYFTQGCQTSHFNEKPNNLIWWNLIGRFYSAKTDLTAQCKFNAIGLCILVLAEVLINLNDPDCIEPYVTFLKLGWVPRGTLVRVNNHYCVLNCYSCCCFPIVCTTHLQMLAMLLALRTRQLIKASCRIFLEACKVQYCRFTKYHFIDFSSKPSSIFVWWSWTYPKTRNIFPDYKYHEALNIANIDTLYDRCEWLSFTLFNEISHTNDHKLASLLPSRSKCRKLRNKRTFDIPSLLLLAIFIELVCILLVFILALFLIILFIDKVIIVMYFTTYNSVKRLQGLYI